MAGFSLRTVWLNDPDGVTNYFAQVGAGARRVVAAGRGGPADRAESPPPNTAVGSATDLAEDIGVAQVACPATDV